MAEDDAVVSVTVWKAMGELEYDLNYTLASDIPIGDLLAGLPYTTAAKNAMRGTS